MTVLRAQKVRGQGSLDAWVDRHDCLLAARRRRSAEKRWNPGRTRRSKRGRRVMFTVFPSKSPSANRNAYVGWCNLRPSSHAGPGLAWSWRLTRRYEVRGWLGGGGGGSMRWTKKHCELLGFSVCCQTRNYKVLFIFLTPRWLHMPVL